MHPNDWIEIDHNYVDNLEEKRAVIEKYGTTLGFSFLVTDLNLREGCPGLFTGE
jgi:hypothetical protein